MTERRPIERRVVDDDERAIGGLLDIELDEVSAERDGPLEGRSRVFRRLAERTPVTAHQWSAIAVGSPYFERRHVYSAIHDNQR
jgi:hypothetical protein